MLPNTHIPSERPSQPGRQFHNIYIYMYCVQPGGECGRQAVCFGRYRLQRHSRLSDRVGNWSCCLEMEVDKCLGPTLQEDS